MPEMSHSPPRDLIDEATFEFTLGNHTAALAKLDQALTLEPDSLDGWLARAEVLFDQRLLDEALTAAERAHQLAPEDVHVNTTLSRIWMERGDKQQAEHFGAQARMMGWKQELQGPADAED